MAGQLTTEQVLLLNNLMYMGNTEPLKNLNDCEGQTLGDVISNIDVNELDSNKEYSTFTNGDEWKDIIEAVKSDPQLMEVKIVETYNDGNGGKSILFENPSANEAVVVYKGTGSAMEWKDNFQGGAGTDQPDGVSTAQQEKALEWYQSLDTDSYDSMTVSGHSKGGNKAKYITVMDDSVDRCISFDGQGFSDEFVEKYQDRIADNQYKIQNHNVDKDCVNVLLNDIGEQHYYEGDNYGTDNILEHHTPNAFLHFNGDGSYHLVPGEQSQDMKNIDEFLNNYIRSLPEAERQDTLQLIGELAEIFTSDNYSDDTDKINDLIDVLLDEQHVDQAGNLLAYFIRYEQENPEVAETIRNIMKEMGGEDYVEVLDTIVDLVNSDEFNDKFGKVLDKLDSFTDSIPNWLLEWICKKIKEKTGIEISLDQARDLLGIFESVQDNLPNVKIKDNGGDIRVKDTVQILSGDFTVNCTVLKNAVQELQNCRQELSQISNQVGSVYRELDGVLSVVKLPLGVQRKNVVRRMNACGKLQEALENIVMLYANAEEKNIGAL